MLVRRGDRDARLRWRARAAGLAPLTVLAAAVALAGCGGSSETTKADYIKKVNALCASEKAAMDAIAVAKVKLTVTLDESNRERERANSLIAAVKLPKKEPISSEWLAARQAALKAAKADSAAGFGTKAARGPEREYFAANSRAERLARAYGLTKCVGFAGS
jgi:hypothetical protein